MNAYIYLTISCEASGSKVANQANHEPYPGDWYIWLGAVVCKGGVSGGWARGGGGLFQQENSKKYNFLLFT